MIQTSSIKALITDDIIKQIMEQYGAHPYSENNSIIIFPTICHNHSAEQASPKLYYYKNSKMFYCFTECNKSYDIFDLLVTIEHLRGNKQYTFFDALYYLSEKLKIHEGFFEQQEENIYQSKKDYYRKKNSKVPFVYYDNNIINYFNYYLPYEWAKDGLTLQELKKFNIRYYPSENEMIIPHYDSQERLVGIRIRAFSDDDIQKGKYRPLKLENMIYSHPLSQFCYGLWITKENIRKTQKAIIFESEKSVCLAEQLEYNNSVACCGSNISKVQIQQLISFGAKEIIIAFDKEFTKENKKQEQYYNKLYKLAEKYKLYCNMSFIFDFNNILNEKQSPIDNNIEQFNYLLEKRIRL